MLVLAPAGTAQTTARLVRDLVPETQRSPLMVQRPVTAGGKAFFSATTLEHGAELWVSSGKPADTRRLTDLYPGFRSSWPGAMMEMSGKLYFTADDGKKGREIWRTDGTTKGTRLVHETARGEGSTQPVEFTADGESIYFLGGQLSPGGDLWRTDGSKKGTVQLTVPEQKGLSGLAPALSFSPPIVALGN